MNRIRIVLAEDHVLVREGTRRILEQQADFDVVGETGDGQEVLQLIGALQPDVAILDVRMPGMNAIEVTRQVRIAGLDTRILMLTAYDDDDYVVAALEAGAQGYLLKTVRAAELEKAVRAVYARETVLHPSIAARMTQILMKRNGGGAETECREVLSPREWEVLQLAAQGLRNRDIATRMGVSSRTVEGHFSSILNKLGVSSRTAAVMHATAQRWLSRSDAGGHGTGVE
jgi:two-component system, NarL family, response regulator LiaR